MPSSDPMIHLYVDIRASEDDHIPWQIAFFDQPDDAFPRVDGNIEAGPECEIIVFEKLSGDWAFHDLTLHPMGPEIFQLDFQWLVTDDQIRLRDTGATGGESKPRTFSYAISAQIKGEEPCKVYFDPQLVNMSGGGPKTGDPPHQKRR